MSIKAAFEPLRHLEMTWRLFSCASKCLKSDRCRSALSRAPPILTAAWLWSGLGVNRRVSSCSTTRAVYAPSLEASGLFAAVFASDQREEASQLLQIQTGMQKQRKPAKGIHLNVT